MNWRVSSRPTASKVSSITGEGAPEAARGIDPDGPHREGREPPARYGRARFLADAAWMGLDITSAFSRSELRRQRDRLMNTHHPDRGGAENMAVRVNETYARMAAWLDRRRFRREKYQPKEAIFPVAEPADDRPKRRGAAIRIRAAQLYAAAMMAAVGYTMFRRRR